MPPPKPDTFFRRLTRLREAAGISRYRLSQLAGISQAYLGDLERGSKQPSLAIARKLAHALGRKLDAWDD